MERDQKRQADDGEADQRERLVVAADLWRGQQEQGQRLERVEADVADLKMDVRGIKADVVGIKIDMSVMKGDIRELKTDVAELKTDMAELKTDMTGVKGQLNRLEIATARGFERVAAEFEWIRGKLSDREERGR